MEPNECPDPTVTHPNVTTLYRCNASQMLIIHANGSGDHVPVQNADDSSRSTLDLSERGLVVLDKPPRVVNLNLAKNSVKQADFSDDRIVYRLDLSFNNLSSIEQFKLPSQLYEVDLTGNHIQASDPSWSNMRMGRLNLSHNNLTTMDAIRFPLSTKTLNLSYNFLQTMETLLLPTSIEYFFMRGNKLEALENYFFPNLTTRLAFDQNQIQYVRGNRFTQKLESLNLDDNPIKEFEIRESDILVFKNLSSQSYTANQHTTSTCSDPNAKKITLFDDKEFCVISDASFRAKYASKMLNLRPGDLDSLNDTLFSKSSKSASNTTTIVIAIVAGLLVLGLAVGAFVVLKRRRQNAGNASLIGTRTATTATATTTVGGGGSGALRLDCLQAQNDAMLQEIHKDKKLRPFEVAGEEVTRIQQIARGGYGIIYLASFRGHYVAQKQILPSRAADSRAVTRFVNEIRLNTMLSHPNIVEFIGACWSSVLELSFLLEYMTNGDLYSVLKSHRDSDSSEQMFGWFDSKSEVSTCKSRIALDIAEALVYLHSFQNPIVHRDLKSRNVLFNEKWQAKLSDFGESCQKAVDVHDETLTMTSEVGTVAWTAPEVLKGVRYNEKADIYSFGVILSELDTCQHPYGKEVVEQLGAGDSKALTSTRVAVLVCSGAISPKLSSSCPEGIRDLALSCLSHIPDERPMAFEIHYTLRKLGACRPRTSSASGSDGGDSSRS